MKRFLSIFLSICVLLTTIAVIPFFASAEEAELKWDVLLEVKPEDFSKVDGSGGGGKNGNVITQATIDETVINLRTIANDASSAGHWATSKWSNLGLITAYVAANGISTEGAPYTGEGAKVLFAHRGDVNWGGDLATPASGVTVSPIYGGKEVNVGDTIRITAWVYADGIVEHGTKTQIADQTTPVDVRMWVYDPWKSNSEKGYNTNATVGGISLNTTMVSDKWTKLELEYDVTEAHQVINSLCIDNKTDSPNPYPIDLYFAGLTVERTVKPKPTPTPTPPPTPTPKPTPTPTPGPTVRPTLDPSVSPKIQIDGIDVEENGDYYRVYVSYTIKQWMDEMELAVLAYDITNIIEGTEDIEVTPVGYLSQDSAEVDGGVFEFDVKKAIEETAEDEAIASFTPGSVMLVKIGVGEVATSAAKIYTFSEEEIDPTLPQIKLYADADCTEKLRRMDDIAYARIENTETDGLSLIVAGYDSKGKIISFVKVAGDEVAEINTEGCSYIKAFAWDFSNITPLLGSVKFPK